jgi:hypothetical protein
VVIEHVPFSFKWDNEYNVVQEGQVHHVETYTFNVHYFINASLHILYTSLTLV